jgi:uncharacterized Ntn-hydrolase superfamily protein
LEKRDIEKLQEVDDRSKSNTRRIDEHEKKIEALEKTYSIMEKMEYRMENVETSVLQINKKLDDSANEKGKKWDKLIDYLFYFVLALLLGYIASQIGM